MTKTYTPLSEFDDRQVLPVSDVKVDDVVWLAGHFFDVLGVEVTDEVVYLSVAPHGLTDEERYGAIESLYLHTSFSIYRRRPAAPLRAGGFVHIPNTHHEWEERMEVVAIRGERVYVIDGEGDPAWYRADQLVRL